MTAAFRVRRCESCHARYLPRPGPCPHCGATGSVAHDLPAAGEVLAAVELSVVAAGWTAPHRLALLEAPEGVRLLAEVRGPLPAIGTLIAFTEESGRYVVLGVPVQP